MSQNSLENVAFSVATDTIASDMQGVDQNVDQKAKWG
jgi:hypothetical protein